jgi:hypothetical protein
MYIDGMGLYGAYYVPNAVDPFGMDKTITVQFELNKGKWGKFIDAMRKAKSAVDGMRSLTSLFPFGIVPYARYWEGDMAFRGRLSIKYDEKTCKLLKVDALASVQADVNAEAGFSMEYGIVGGYIGLFGKAEAGGSVGAYWEKGSGTKGYGAANVAVTAGINGGVHATIVRVNVWGGLRASVQLRAETPPFKIIWDPSISGAMGVDIQRRRGFFDWTWSTIASWRMEGGDLLGEYGKPTDIWKAGKEYVDELDNAFERLERHLRTPLDRNGWSKEVLFSDD